MNSQDKAKIINNAIDRVGVAAVVFIVSYYFYYLSREISGKVTIFDFNATAGADGIDWGEITKGVLGLDGGIFWGTLVFLLLSNILAWALAVKFYKLHVKAITVKGRQIAELQGSQDADRVGTELAETGVRSPQN